METDDVKFINKHLLKVIHAGDFAPLEEATDSQAEAGKGRSSSGSSENHGTPSQETSGASGGGETQQREISQTAFDELVTQFSA